MTKVKTTQKIHRQIPKNLSKIEKKEKPKKKASLKSTGMLSHDIATLPSSKHPKLLKEISEDDFNALWAYFPSRNGPIVKAKQDWQSQLLKEKEDKLIPLSIRQRLKEHAQSLYFEDLSFYKKDEHKRTQSSDGKLRKVVLSHGTTKDKIAALALECMESPIHTLNSFNNLVNYVSPKGKNQYSEIIDHIKNLVESTYLANRYVAKEFECHNFSMLIPLIKTNREKVEQQLVLWYFEDQFCYSFKSLVKNLEMLATDTVHQTKIVGLKGLLGLLYNHPLQMNEEIIGKLVNKLGDSSQKTSNFVQQGLSNVIRRSPFLKLTVVAHVEEILYRPNVPKRAQYFALSFLKDFVLKDGEEKLAHKLSKLYMSFFKSCSKSGEVDSRFMSILLRGLYRAYPFAQKGGDVQALDEQINTLYKLCHFVNFNIATQALQLIYQVQIRSAPETSNRFYQVVYNQLLDPCFGNASSCSSFLNLVFKVMCKDPEVHRVRAFSKRLLQVAKYQPPQNVCGILYLLSEVTKDNAKLGDLKSLFGPSTSHNLLEAEISDDDEEFYPDLDADDEGNIINNKKRTKRKCGNSLKKPCSSASWIHRSNTNEDSAHFLKTTHYDPSIRNPLYSGAQLTCLWELIEFQAHYHPTVSLFASRILDGIFIEYSGDPLEDFTLMRFLDRFIHRNPKKTKEDKSSLFYGNKPQVKGSKRFNVNSEQFARLQEDKVPVEDRFFHKYFTSYAKINLDEQRKDIEDTDDVDDDEFDQIMRKKNLGQFVDLQPDMDEIDFERCASKVKELDGFDNLDEDFNNTENFDEDSEDFDDDQNLDDTESFDEEHSDIDENEESFEEDWEDISQKLDEESMNSDSSDDIPQKKKKHKKSKFGADDLSGMLADADDFAHLFADGYGNSTGMSQDVFVKDKSSTKQLSWEKNRYGSSSKKGTKKKDSLKQKKKFNKLKR